MSVTTVAFVGAVGGAGTTRTTVEVAAALARDGRAVAVLDAAYATQGLADHLSGRLAPDLTALVTDESDADLAAGLVDLAVDAPGRVACCPARAPFERLARAKTTDAARALERRVDEAADEFDHVLLDTPPVAANQALAAVRAAERVVAVTPATRRGADGLQRLRARLQDVDASLDTTLAIGGDLPAADATLPETDHDAVADAPVAADGDSAYVRAVAAGAELAVDAELALELGSDGLLDRELPGR